MVDPRSCSAETPAQRAEAAFAARFGRAPACVARAPGRVNLIGEHTDYSEGWVLPVAIDLDTAVALGPRADRRIRLVTLELRDTAILELDRLEPTRAPGWSAYPCGVVWALQQRGLRPRGFDAVIASAVPPGAGLASSAALELALARGLAELWGWPWEPLEAARACRQAEAEVVGVRCGPMDQLCAAAGRAGHALLIDCRDQSIDPRPWPEALALVVLDTGTRRRLEGSEFNDRRRACERAARRLGVAALRDVNAGEQLEEALARLPPELHPVVRHVVQENHRTRQAAVALGCGDFERLGRLLDQGHRSLRDDYRVSAPALDRMVALCRRHPACVGARLTGAGFAGCVVALAERSAAEDFARSTAAAYGADARAHVLRASDGARLVRTRT